MQKRILLTGFEPFAGSQVNASERLIQALENERLSLACDFAVLPTEYDSCFASLRQKIELTSPTTVLCFGEASGRAAVEIERLAVNLANREIPDNAGKQLLNQKIAARGPDALFTTLPLDLMVQAGRLAGVPTQASNSAGTFVCNYLLYSLLHFAMETELKAGFIHIPLLPEAATDRPQLATMATDTVVTAVKAILKVIA